MKKVVIPAAHPFPRGVVQRGEGRSTSTSGSGDDGIASNAPSVPRTYRSRNASVYAEMISKPRDGSMIAPPNRVIVPGITNGASL